jgi:ABC-type bacteriocin/lantibiotic exporter with double-glycine peptidase domain
MFSSGKRLLLGTFLVLVAVLALEMAIPLGINNMIDALEADKNMFTFFVGILIFTGAYFVLCLLTAANTKLYIRIGNKLLWNMREKIYQVLWRSSYLENVQKNKDKFKFVLSNQTYTAFAIAVIYTLGGVANTLTAAAFLCIAFIYSAPVGIALIVSIAVTLLVSFVTGRSILNGYEATNHAQEKDTAQIYETVDMTEAVRTNGLETYYLNKNKKIHHEFMHLSEKAESISAFCETVEGSLHALIYIIVAGILLLTTDVNGGEIVTILFVTNLTLETSQRVQRQLQVIMKNIPAFENVVELMEVPLENGRGIEKIDSITFENLSLEIDDRTIIHDLSRSIGKGENILIRGENGSGKSSLLKMILGLYKPTGGKILLNGTDINEYDCNSFYKEICYISQEELMPNESVEDYLRYVTHSDMDDAHIRTLRAKVKLKKDIQKIEENGLTLSGGEKKKIFMLKCLMEQNASVVILDEIDAGLDDETKVILKELENNLKNDPNKILMKISHIDTDATGFDQVIQL